jgi:NADPH:quinone reductase-like Zn-dependent oxidoreductase
MKAATYHRFGEPDVVAIDDVVQPTPKADQVLVRVYASTVSIADHRARAKALPPGMGAFGHVVFGLSRPKNPVLGMDYAGIVDAVGADVTRFSVGDHVYGMRGTRYGAHAEYLVAKAEGTIALQPQGWTHEDSVALLFGGTTAIAFLRGVNTGDAVLINGATAATGSMAVQIAASRGAIVTGVSSAANHPLVLSLGAQRAIDYATTDFASEGNRYDAIMDCVGNAPFDRILGSLAPGGAFLPVITSLAGMVRDGSKAKRAGVTVLPSNQAVHTEDVIELTRLAEAGSIRPVIDSTFDLDDIVDAHRRVDTGRKRGAVVVRIN